MPRFSPGSACGFGAPAQPTAARLCVAVGTLATDRLLAQFATNRQEARRRYVAFVAEGIGQESIWQDLNRQIYLGDEVFVE